MKILVTGAKGFVGRNLCAELKNIRDGKASCWGLCTASESLANRAKCVEEVFEYDIDSTPEELDHYCRECDFVFNLAGINRPQNHEEFMEGNFGFASTLLDTLRKYGNACPVMLSSSQQASLAGRFGNSDYGRSKKAGEDLFFKYGVETGAKVLVYRFPNIFGKWCRPNYNSAVATFCNAFANDLPYTVTDPSVELELLYIDDLIAEMIGALKGEEHHCEFDGLEAIPCEGEVRLDSASTAENGMERSGIVGLRAAEGVTGVDPASKGEERSESAVAADRAGRYCYCPVTFKATLGEIVALLEQFKQMPQTLMIPEIPADGFAKRLYSAYLSYLPKEKACFNLKMNVDARGSFTELVHTPKCGQVSINISKPGITKGQHWHHTKWEQFIVVKGHGLIQMRPENPTPAQIDADGKSKILEFEVSGDKIQSVIMLPGYTHNIINLSDTEDLVTVMYCNEIFDPTHPDTYGDPI